MLARRFCFLSPFSPHAIKYWALKAASWHLNIDTSTSSKGSGKAKIVPIRVMEEVASVPRLLQQLPLPSQAGESMKKGSAGRKA